MREEWRINYFKEPDSKPVGERSSSQSLHKRPMSVLTSPLITAMESNNSCRSHTFSELRCAISMFIIVVMFSRAGSRFRSWIVAMWVFGLVYFVLMFAGFSDAVAYDPLDPTGNITIKWDVMSWTPDGYVVSFPSDWFLSYDSWNF